MKPYADLRGRRTVQVVADLLVLVWILLFAWIGGLVHDAVAAVAAPARQLERTGGDFHDTMAGAATSLEGLPIVEDRLSRPFRSVASTGTEIERTGRDIATSVEHLAVVAGWVAALVPVALVLGVWLTLRLRFARRAGAAQRLVHSSADLDLFALRALARQPMTRVARVSADPAGAWRRGEQRTIRSLAVLELRSTGLRPPAAPPDVSG